MLATESGPTRKRLSHRVDPSHPRRRHHTLDNATLDQFDFICVPLHLNEVSLCLLPAVRRGR